MMSALFVLDLSYPLVALIKLVSVAAQIWRISAELTSNIFADEFDV